MAKLFRRSKAGGRDPLCQDAFFAIRHGSRARALVQIRRYRIYDASKAYKEQFNAFNDKQAYSKRSSNSPCNDFDNKDNVFKYVICDMCV